jgi:hypothetical protein
MTDSGMKIVVHILSLALSIISVVGLYYLTNFAFNAKPGNEKTCVSNYSETKLNFSKVTVVVLWLQIAVVAVNAVLAFA